MVVDLLRGVLSYQCLAARRRMPVLRQIGYGNSRCILRRMPASPRYFCNGDGNSARFGLFIQPNFFIPLSSEFETKRKLAAYCLQVVIVACQQ